ncbi:tetratricopeptide repeat protein [Polynucleobacter sp. MWH-UH2A]|uniref:O-linked N-acetylglucosamine transferase, SPINDLY family protein n=1 Tax=Polynucleobacter sp. MWH-UH2A TaxID=1855617 RepID=UPI001BFE317B|nr:tetratricopeptide repeat protein [Polynucleobacter sp. MWH-UH2A]QWD64177.1 tetratricopeptide repeat protein [Polynucleobacter sp. MWH-UH2A]
MKASPLLSSGLFLSLFWASVNCFVAGGLISIVMMNKYELAIEYIEKGQFPSAINILRDILNRDKESVDVLHALGLALASSGDLNEAKKVFQKILMIDDSVAEVHYNLGRIEELSDRNSDALVQYSAALSINPSFYEALISKGMILNSLCNYSEALVLHKNAIALNPLASDGWANAGISYAGLGRYEEALVQFEAALKIDPLHPFLYGQYLFAKMKICHWEGYQGDKERIASQTLMRSEVSEPFPILAISNDLELNLMSAKIWSDTKFPRRDDLGNFDQKGLSKKIKIGYFSPDFREHPIAGLTAELYELHDRNEFEVIAFSWGAKKSDPVHQKVRRTFDIFLDIDNLSDYEVAKISREMGVNIAIDLAGYTQNSRTGIFAFRAAPVQISYLGYLGTMGADYIDYLIADRVLVNSCDEKYYSEKIIYLPSYQVNNRHRTISDRVFTKADLGIKNEDFVFCCFNNNFKFSPDMFTSWLSILNAVEKSMLLLYADSEAAKNNLRKFSRDFGISEERIIFAGRLPPSEYLARYRVADLFLDTFPYNAGTTASDALWAGLPVLTLKGNTFSSRMAASLLTTLNLTELIVDSLEDYEKTAIRLAKNFKEMAHLRKKLAIQKHDSLLFNTPQFVANLERSYRIINARHQNNLRPENILI